jgi:hypothetical protein
MRVYQQVIIVVLVSSVYVPIALLAHMAVGMRDATEEFIRTITYMFERGNRSNIK